LLLFAGDAAMASNDACFAGINLFEQMGFMLAQRCRRLLSSATFANNSAPIDAWFRTPFLRIRRL
jgi:hypothetical protein